MASLCIPLAFHQSYRGIVGIVHSHPQSGWWDHAGMENDGGVGMDILAGLALFGKSSDTIRCFSRTKWWIPEFLVPSTNSGGVWTQPTNIIENWPATNRNVTRPKNKHHCKFWTRMSYFHIHHCHLVYKQQDIKYLTEELHRAIIGLVIFSIGLPP